MTVVQANATDPSLQGGRVAGVTATGRVYFWQGGSLWIGEGKGRTEWHEHHAHQLALALEGSFRFRAQSDGAWTDFEGALVPSECTHQFEINGTALIAHLFVEPESSAGRALAASFGSRGVSALPSDEARTAARSLFNVLQGRASTDAMVETATAAIATLSGVAAVAGEELDPRLARGLDYVRANIRKPIALADVAAAVALSESRFRHLFVEGTGSSFRAYLLWLRINLAIEAVMAGASWTEAAHDAGFADSAHLTRTHKRMFGIEPTAIRPVNPSAGREPA